MRVRPSSRLHRIPRRIAKRLERRIARVLRSVGLRKLPDGVRPCDDRAAQREGLIEMIPEGATTLEIGPFDNPVIRRPGTRYFDVLDREGLMARQERLGRKPREAPEIDYVSPTGDLSVIDARFDYVVSCHCIEHQPDLVRHLQGVGNLLEPGGRYLLIVPDKRYCFDALIAPSTIAGVLQAHHEGRRVHSLASVIEHRVLTTHNWPYDHWDGYDIYPGHASDPTPAVRAALDEYAAAGGAYIDVHAWQFTPMSLMRILRILRELGLSPFTPEFVCDTPFPTFEFTACLRNDP